MGSIKYINDEDHFQSELAAADGRLVVADFTATWCGPCQRIAPIFQRLAGKYLKAVFLKIDVDRCQEVAAAQGISAMPTFIFYKNRAKVDRLQGADPTALENKIALHYVSEDGDEDGSLAGHMDLSPFILKTQCECLNENDEHPLSDALTAGDGFLESNCDPQLLVSITFIQSVKIHSLKIKGPADKGPKNVKIFINQPRTLDFDMAESFGSVQELQLGPNDLDGSPINLRYVKFQNVNNIQFFIKDNQIGSDITRVDNITIIGTPITTTNLEGLKRVAGKKGEAH